MRYFLFYIADGEICLYRPDASHEEALVWYKAGDNHFYCNESDFDRMVKR